MIARRPAPDPFKDFVPLIPGFDPIRGTFSLLDISKDFVPLIPPLPIRPVGAGKKRFEITVKDDRPVVRTDFVRRA